jgi:predicted Zn finger-like uncharacterized protein
VNAGKEMNLTLPGFKSQRGSIMNFSCPGCKLAGKIDDRKIPLQGAYTTCPKCKTRFLVKAEQPVAPASYTAEISEVDADRGSALSPSLTQQIEQKIPERTDRPQQTERPADTPRSQPRTRPIPDAKAKNGAAMNKFLMLVVAVLSAVAAQWVVRNVIFAPPSFDKQIVNACNEINKVAPLEIDRYTRLDTSVPGPGKQITYLYTLSNIAENEITTQVKTSIEESVRKQVAQASDLKSFRDNGVAMVYVYRLPDAKEVFKFTIKN